MASQDHIEIYGLGGIRELVQERLRELGGNSSRSESLEAALGVESRSDHYDIRRKGRKEVVKFSTDGFKEHSQDVLILLADVRYAWSLRRGTWSILRKRRAVTALKYGLVENNLNVGYLQSVAGIQIEQYGKVQEQLGVRPHELLFAHLIARVAPIFDIYPEMNLIFSRHRSSYKILGERFGKKDKCYNTNVYMLNQRKERVRQIFGDGSPWLEAQR